MGKNPLMTALDLLGVRRTEDLLFKCKSDLIGKATEVKTIKENCRQCAKPYIFAWHYTQDGQQKSYRVSEICSNCINGTTDKNMASEIKDMRKQSIASKWYYIPENDLCGFKNYQWNKFYCATYRY